jgi:hypothetical protein
MTKHPLVRSGFWVILLAVACAVAAPTAQADPVVYVTGFGNEFGTLDLTTDAFNLITTLALPAGDTMNGLGYGPGGLLYGVDSEPNANLWQINPSNGALTLIGPIGQSALDATSYNGTLYVLSQDVNALYYQITPPSPTPTVIGSIGLSSGGLMAINEDGTQLYTTTQSTYNLVSINPTTGATSVVGPTGFSVDNGLFVNGTLYGFSTNGAIVTINTATGAGTQVGTYSLPNGDQILASAPVPEPSSLVLGLLGAVGAGFYSRSRLDRRTSIGAARRGD